MADRAATRYVPDVAIPPGETIAEILQERGISQSDLALLLGRTEKNISQLVNGKAPLSPELAIGLERVLGVPAALWNNLESTYRGLVASAAEAERQKGYGDWARTFPLKYLRDNEFIAKESRTEDLPGQLLAFFAAGSPEAWRDYWSSPRRLAARATSTGASNLPALTAWLRAGELQAREIDVAPYDSSAFAKVVAMARQLTRERVDRAFERLEHECAGAGVALVLVPEPPKLGCYGVTRWLPDGRPVIQLCLHRKTADQLWFSFFHEACHVLYHDRKRTYVEDIADRSLEEVEANDFASNILIAPAAWAGFAQHGKPTKASVVGFARSQGIDAGIVVGRLQHERLVPFSYMNDLKTKVDWA